MDSEMEYEAFLDRVFLVSDGQQYIARRQFTAIFDWVDQIKPERSRRLDL